MTHTAVIDTNVLVSSCISTQGKSAEIMNLFYTGKLQVFYSSEIFAEYKRVLAYKRLNIDEKIQSNIIGALEVGGTLIKPPKSSIPLPDESDRTFYDTAKASGAVLITGNIKHYPVKNSKSPFIVTPAEFLIRGNSG